MAFDAKAALDLWGGKEATVIVWKAGWASDSFAFDTLREALPLTQAYHDNAIEIEVHVHLDSADYAIKGDNLKQIAALV